MKITIQQIVNIWRALDDIRIFIDPQTCPHFIDWMHEYRVRMRQEIDVWNGLTDEGRMRYREETIRLPMRKIDADHVPPVPEYLHKDLAPVVTGTLQKPKSQLEQIIEEQKNAT